jgi:hypothetical protein
MDLTVSGMTESKRYRVSYDAEQQGDLLYLKWTGERAGFEVLWQNKETIIARNRSIIIE